MRKKFIARFNASHPRFNEVQHSCITWDQDGDEPDVLMTKGMIQHTTACHFFNMFSKIEINPDEIIVEIEQVMPFRG